MSRINFDQFSKNFLEELLSPIGRVERSKEIPGEPKYADVYFIPAAPPSSSIPFLGVLGQFLVTACLLEPFRNAPSDTEIRDCILKLFWLHSDLRQQAEVPILDPDLAQVCVLATSISAPQLTRFAATPKSQAPPGIYSLGEAMKTNLVSIRELPAIPETLWLRLLGKGETQAIAIQEVLALPKSVTYRFQILQLLAQWKISLELLPNIDSDEDEEERLTVMALSQAYLEWERETEQRGQRLIVEQMLRFRFGTLDAPLQAIIPSVLNLSPEVFTPLLMELSREELLSRFQ
ncbi:MAG: flagellar assembly protein H [Oculatellaceae cyanobacterium Prado106]|jgi:hypothetical protein|nr:flagellar assembly protein H [Oculatellaceae cyanobacterium Prado106]